MQSSVETLSPTRVKLTVEAGFDELKPELDKAYRTIAKQVKIQGFRPGKVPPRILDQRVGRGVVLEEAVNEAIPQAVRRSGRVREGGTARVARTSRSPSSPTTTSSSFTAEVDIRPEFALPAFDSLSVTVDDVVVTDADVDEQLDRPARALRLALARSSGLPPTGDFVALDLVATIDGEEVPGGTAQGLSYEIGSGTLLEGIDEAVTGASAGDVRSFTDRDGRRRARRPGRPTSRSPSARSTSGCCPSSTTSGRRTRPASPTWPSSRPTSAPGIDAGQADGAGRRRPRQGPRGAARRGRAPAAGEDRRGRARLAQADQRRPARARRHHHRGLPRRAGQDRRGVGRRAARRTPSRPSRPSSCSTPSPTPRSCRSPTPSSTTS